MPSSVGPGLLNSSLLSPARRLRFIERTIADLRCGRGKGLENLAEMENLGHRLKGSASTFNFDWLSVLGARLEDHAKSGKKNQIDSVVDEILWRSEEEKREILDPTKYSPVSEVWA